MSPSAWYDLFLFLLLFALYVYVFATVRITNLHKVYFLFHFFMMLWPLCQFAIDLTDDPRLQLFDVTMSFVALSMLGSGWLLLTVFLTGNADKLGKKRLFLLFAPAVIAAVGVIMNPFNLFVAPLGGGYVDRAYGTWFWMVIVILLSYFFASLSVLFGALNSSKTSPMIKKQVKITLWGIFVLATFASIDALLNVVLRESLPIIPGLTSLGIFLSALFFVYVIKKYNVFDLVSIAHEDVINTIPYGILVLDENESIIEVNKALRLFIDLNVGDYFDMETFLGSVRVEGSSKKFLSHYKQKENTLSQIEIIAQRDIERHFILQASPIVDSYPMQIGHIITFQDVSQERFFVKEMNRQNEILQERNHSLDRIRNELSTANRKLEELVLTDSLTNCYNRRYLTQQLTHEVITNIQYKIPFSLILFDIDYFKAINDRYGHVIGDEVLYRTAQAVKQSIRGTDILARYGGEEFMIYLPHTERQLAEQLAERVRLAVESNHILVDHEIEQVSITVSVGGLSIEDFDHEHVPDNPEGYLIQLFAAVDKALYQAKQNGRNRIEFADFQNVSFAKMK
ncbi:diguanylate cyclase (GGDEF) domain-containing protein [Paenibacillus algorifonticola]|uniref:Diguanylate cyclase (GGDEF) domain-containing protein n=1 Tax=Paenibacillus algorifonticola TaxID=684063 RepID=A0A1I2FK45_9BACL|nr:GGDEF domain-containing protein [Paenibacillus algorifonticola]SFF04886.1 diguanylate cyclase (GGDEF) domain-containing protein [Paenibacillus algorifonticola]